MKIVVEIIHAAVAMITIMMREDTAVAVGLETLKDTLKLHVRDGKTGVVIAVAAITAETMAAAGAAIVAMKMITTAMVRAVVGMVILKGMQKQLTEVGKTVVINL
jgi:hypothetical protein